LTEEKSDNQNEEQVADNDDKSPFRSGGIRDRRMLETSLRDIDNNPTHILFKNVTIPANSDTDKNSTAEKKTKPEKDVGHS
jgi:hypothetical protein